MWLLNATTEDQRKGLADYFSPSNQLSHASSGTGDPFGGHTAFDEGALVSDRGAVQAVDGNRPTPMDPADPDTQPYAPGRTGADDDQEQGGNQQAAPPVSPLPAQVTAAVAPASMTAAAATPARMTAAAVASASKTAAAATPTPVTAAAVALAQADPDLPAETSLPRSALPTAATVAQPRNPTEAELRDLRERQEKAEFDQAAQQIRDAVRDDPALADLARQLVIDMTPEGLRIQILDEDRQPMFLLGSAAPNDRAKLLLQKVTPVLAKLPQDISIAGHTDSTPFAGPDRTNWELSTERANATRRLLVEGGLPESRIRSVTGNADRDPLLPADPRAAANRRIAIVVLRAARPAGAAARGGDAAGNAAADPVAAGGVGNAAGDPVAARGVGNAAGDPVAAPGTVAVPAR